MTHIILLSHSCHTVELILRLITKQLTTTGSDNLVKKGYKVENLMDFPGH